MKKRRELDALVNGKVGKFSLAGRRKKNGEHELLQNHDTDSSEIDEFSRELEKGYVRNVKNKHYCSICVSVVSFVLLIACIITCGGLVWMHLQLYNDLQLLKQNMQSVETGASDSSGGQVAINNQIKELQTAKTLFMDQLKQTKLEVDKNITSLLYKINSFERRLAIVEQNVASIPELQSVPKSLQTLTQNVASVQSDVKTLADKVKAVEQPQANYEQDKNNIQLEISKLKNLDHLLEDAAVMNSTMIMEFKKIKMNLSSSETTLGEVINSTEALRLHVELLQQGSSSNTSSTLNDWSNLIHDAVQQAMNETTKMLSSEQIINITKMVEDQQDQIYALQNQFRYSGIDNGRINTTIPQGDIEKMIQNYFKDHQHQYESNISDIRGIVTDLSSVLKQLQSQWAATNAQVTGLESSLQQLVESSGNKWNAVNQQNDTQPQLTEWGHTTQDLAEKHPNGSSTLPVSSVDVMQASSAPRQIIHFWNYNTEHELEIGHSRWDLDGDGKVNPADLPEFFGPNITDADIEAYRKFDFDHDGLLNLEETKIAAGFMPMPTTPALPETIDGTDNEKEI